MNFPNKRIHTTTPTFRPALESLFGQFGNNVFYFLDYLEKQFVFSK